MAARDKGREPHKLMGDDVTYFRALVSQLRCDNNEDDAKWSHGALRRMHTKLKGDPTRMQAKLGKYVDKLATEGGYGLESRTMSEAALGVHFDKELSSVALQAALLGRREDHFTMDARNLQLATGLVDPAYVRQGGQSLARVSAHIRNLLSHRRAPDEGWPEHRIEELLRQLAQMDSNNFDGSVGLGEREARIASPLVERRHFRLGHGIGRSGDIAAIQPKAAGSSLLNKLTNALALDVLKRTCSMNHVKACLVLPMATGMSLALAMQTLRSMRPPSARYVIWPRIDQKSCFKAILTAGFTPVVVENVREGDELRTDLQGVERAIARLGPENVLCVMSTTSCFAPRGMDRVEELAKLCKRAGVGHIINNAYGVQAGAIANAINQACNRGRVDAFVQSTDKNFMVPVGGAILASSDAAFVEKASQTYPGRASVSPILDLFITLLHLGHNGYKRLLQQRKSVFRLLKDRLTAVAEANGARVLSTPHNPISLAMTVDSITGPRAKSATYFGSLMFSRGVSGTRVVPLGARKTIGPRAFTGYGSHCDDYGANYMTAAASVGLTAKDVHLFETRLLKCIQEMRKQLSNKGKGGGKGKKGGSEQTEPHAGAGAGAGTGAGAGAGACAGAGKASGAAAGASDGTPAAAASAAAVEAPVSGGKAGSEAGKSGSEAGTSASELEARDHAGGSSAPAAGTAAVAGSSTTGTSAGGGVPAASASDTGSAHDSAPAS